AGPGGARGVADAIERLGLDPAAVRDVVVLVGTGYRRGAGLALHLAARLLRQRAEVAPGQRERGAAGQEVIPAAAMVPAEHLARAELHELDEQLQRAQVAGALDQRRHRPWF